MPTLSEAAAPPAKATLVLASSAVMEILPAEVISALTTLPPATWARASACTVMPVSFTATLPLMPALEPPAKPMPMATSTATLLALMVAEELPVMTAPCAKACTELVTKFSAKAKPMPASLPMPIAPARLMT